MATPRIFTDQPLQEGLSLLLETDSSRHVAQSLRMQPGDSLTLFNGSGGEFEAVISDIRKKQVAARVGAYSDRGVESPLQLHLGVAMSRGERMDWVIQKSTELGAASITPLLSERCEVRLNSERQQKKLRHWQRIAISACEQCGRNSVPDIELPAQLEGWCAQVNAGVKLVLHHRGATRNPPQGRPASAALLIGPEGGLTDSEVALAEKQGFTAMRLGPRVLRTETAPLAACAILQARWGDMG